jgi:hypothetical protein
MKPPYLPHGHRVAGLLIGLWLLAMTTWAQVPTWTLAIQTGTSSATGYHNPAGMATDASGNVFVTGSFSGNVTFGSTTLSSAGGDDIYLAKYVPSTNTWAWAVRGGGARDDFGWGVAVSGTNVYLTGALVNNATNLSSCTFSDAATSSGTAPQAGASSGSVNLDIVLVKYIDNGTSATFGWSQVGGGTESDMGWGVAVSGDNVYVTGSLMNSTTNATAVVFGGTGTTAGILPQYGASTNILNGDIVLAKYIDHGPTATVAWTQVAGGVGKDTGKSVAVSGTSVYVIGTLENNNTNDNTVVFGAAGTTTGTLPQAGASPTSSLDMVLAKYTDTGASATVAWTQVGGGTGPEYGAKVAVSGNSVYVVGSLFNDQANTYAVLFGGMGTTTGTFPQTGASATASYDIVLAKYFDNGPTATFGWSQVAGGTDQDAGQSMVTTGSSIYLTGHTTSNAANTTAVLFGGTGTTVGTVAVPGFGTSATENILVAKYVDNGTSAGLAWTQAADAATPGSDGTDLALAGSRLYVLGRMNPPARFGSISLNSSYGEVSVLAALDLPSVLATAPPTAVPTPHLYPNPATGMATLSGVPAKTIVIIFSLLGCRVAIATADATGAATLPAGLSPGLYLVRADGATMRWVVE